MRHRLDSPAPLYAHGLTRGGRGAHRPADRLVGGGVLGRERRRPNAPRTDLSNAGLTA